MNKEEFVLELKKIGIDITDDTKVLYRKNHVIKNISFKIGKIQCYQYYKCFVFKECRFSAC